MKSFKLSIHGSRSLSDERVKIIIMEEIKKHEPTTLVTYAEPGGVCEIARDLCKEIALPLKLHFLNFRYLRGAFEHRSKDAIADSDHCIFIHDGKSKGTLNEMKLAKKMRIPFDHHELPPAEHDKSVGFDIEVDWDQLILDDSQLEESFAILKDVNV